MVGMGSIDNIDKMAMHIVAWIVSLMFILSINQGKQS